MSDTPGRSAEQVVLTDYERTMLHADHSTPINRGWRSCPICPVGVVERIVAARLAPISAVLVEEYGDDGHDVWCPRSEHYESVSDHPRGDRPCDCLAGRLRPHLPPAVEGTP